MVAPWGTPGVRATIHEIGLLVVSLVCIVVVAMLAALGKQIPNELTIFTSMCVGLLGGSELRNRTDKR